MIQYILYAALIAFGIIAVFFGALDVTGSLVAIFFGVLILHSSGLNNLIILIAFLVIGSLSTRFRYRYKKELGASEPNEGRRSINPVIANGIIPTFMAVLGNPYLLVGSLSAALADTMATEIGLLDEIAILPTTGKRVKAGTRGAISFYGEMAAVIGSLIIAGLAILLTGGFYIHMIVIAVISGLIGCNVDSMLGASLSFFSKEEVNLLGTLTGAAISASIALWFSLPV